MTDPEKPESDPTSYEQGLAELEQLVKSMESGQMPLDALLASYKRAAHLLEFCRTRLQGVQDQVKVLENGRLADWSAG